MPNYNKPKTEKSKKKKSKKSRKDIIKSIPYPKSKY